MLKQCELKNILFINELICFNLKIPQDLSKSMTNFFLNSHGMIFSWLILLDMPGKRGPNYTL